MLTLLYFAKLRDELNCASEELQWQDNFRCINDIKFHLQQRQGQWANSFANANIVSALNQTVANGDTPINNGDEIAFFPPVTGG